VRAGCIAAREWVVRHLLLLPGPCWGTPGSSAVGDSLGRGGEPGWFLTLRGVRASLAAGMASWNATWPGGDGNVAAMSVHFRVPA